MGNKERVAVLIVEKEFAGLEAISDFVQRMCSQEKIGFKKTWELMLSIDEICSTLITCSYNDGQFIRVIWVSSENKVHVKIEENGSPFNPLKNFDEEDAIYGLGPQIIETMVDEAKYERENNFNCILITKKIRKK